MLSMYEDLIGVVLGERYEIQDLFSAEGMAWTFVAHDRHLDCDVMIKILKPQYPLSADAINTIAHLKHRHILRVCDQGVHTSENQELTYLVMRLPVRLSECRTLAELLRWQNLRPRDAERILRQVCEALDFAYSYGLTHSGLTPSSILLDEHADVLLTNFVPAQQLTKTVASATQTDEPGKQTLSSRNDVFSGLCNLCIALYKRVLISTDRSKISPTAALRRWALLGVLGLALIVAAVALTLFLVRPSFLGAPKEALYATISPNASVLPTVTSTVFPSLTPGLSPSATTAATLAPSPPPHLVVSIERLPIYAGPAEVYEKLGEVRRGDQLALRGRSEDGKWWQVDYLGWKGWVRAQSAGPSVDPTVLPIAEASSTPMRTATPTEEAMPSPVEPIVLGLQNPSFEGIRENSIPGWSSWAADNYPDDPYDSQNSFDTPGFSQTDDPARMIDGATLQIEATAFVNLRVHVFQTVSAPPSVTVRFQASAKAYSNVGGIRLSAGIDPSGGPDCSQVRWGDTLTVDQSSGTVQLIAPDVAVGRDGRVTVCLRAENVLPGRSNAAFLDNAILIANPQ